MSTEVGEVQDALDPDLTIEVSTASNLIRLFSSEKKIFLNEKEANKLVDLLYRVYLYLGWDWNYE
jgi:hypothetical protein